MKKLTKLLLLLVPFTLSSCTMNFSFWNSTTTNSGVFSDESQVSSDDSSSENSDSSDDSSSQGSSSNDDSGSSSDDSSNNDSSDNNSSSSETEQEDTNIYPSSLTIEGPSEIFIGEPAFLSASFSPSNISFPTVEWTSSNDQKILLEQSGRVVGLEEGNIIITASLKGPQNSFVTATHNLKISYAKASSISLNEEEITLFPGGTYQLIASISPSQAVDTITWSSSEPNVASVGDFGLVTANSAGESIITATTSKGLEAECLVTVSPSSNTTIFIYMCGADLESESKRPGYLNSRKQGLASMDLDEIISVPNQPDGLKIIVQTGGAKAWAKEEIDANKTQRWEIKNGEMLEKENLSKTNMGSSSTLQSFLEWGFENYNAEKYGVVFWNHGGAMSGVCFDENYNDDGLTHDEIASAVTSARENCEINNKLEWVVYDACLMAVQDVIDYNSINFNYMLASQESESGYGYDYDAWLPSLYENLQISTETLLETIGHTFIEEERAIYNTYHESFDQTQSAFDLSKAGEYKSTFEDFATSLNLLMTTSSNISKAKNDLNNSQKYGKTIDTVGQAGTIYPFDIFDVESSLTKLKTDFPTLTNKINAVISKIEELVFYEEHGEATTGSGLCLFCPISGYNYNYACQGYQDGPATNYTSWSNVTQKIFRSLFNV